MKALLAGYGGIGSAVYYPEMLKLGYEIDILDNNQPNCKYSNIEDVHDQYDLAVICTPNYTHLPFAEHLGRINTSHVFVEKPGVHAGFRWRTLVGNYQDTQYHLIKNNLYRNDYGRILDINLQDVSAINFNWINKNRVPNPGSWFTDKKLAFGGVSYDLMPHLYCLASLIFGDKKLSTAQFRYDKMQMWTLNTVGSTEYGTINPNGKYNVDDTAHAKGVIDNIVVNFNAAWKGGYDEQAIIFYMKDGSQYRWDFGLCPSEAYGLMLQDTKNSFNIDHSIHEFLDKF